METQLKHSASSPPPLSSFSSSLSYKSLNSLYSVVGDKKLFKHVFLVVWAYLFPLRMMDNFLLYYGVSKALKLQRTIKLTESEFYLLAKLIYLAGPSRGSVDSRKIDKPGKYNNNISKLLQLGLISRSHFDPSFPYLLAHRTIQKVYISVTPVGYSFHNSMVESLRNIAANDLLKAST